MLFKNFDIVNVKLSLSPTAHVTEFGSVDNKYE